MSFEEFANLLGHFAKAHNVEPTDVLFGEGLDIPSVAFLEFVLELEVLTGLDIDIESLDTSIQTAGQLHQRLFAGRS